MNDLQQLYDRTNNEFCNELLKHFTYYGQIHKDTVTKESHLERSLDLPGLYILKDQNTLIRYIGETGNSIKKRLLAHMKSLVNKDSVKEHTHRFFAEANIDTTQSWHVYFLDAKKMKMLSSKQDRRRIEQQLIYAHKQTVVHYFGQR